MTQIGKINNDTENKMLCALFGFVLTGILSIIIYKAYKLNILKEINLNNIIQIVLIPLVVTTTLIIHEIIHIIAFKYFGKGQARVRVRRNKEAGAIVIQQMNNELFYNKIETIVILLAPFIILTIASLIMLTYKPFQLAIYFNCILNSVGSSIDIYVALRLIFCFPNYIKIRYNNGEEVGMEIYK